MDIHLSTIIQYFPQNTFSSCCEFVLFSTAMTGGGSEYIVYHQPIKITIIEKKLYKCITIINA